MAVVVPVSGVVYCVIAGTHDRPDLTVDAVMNVCRPDTFAEQKKHMGQEMGWDKEKRNHMWYCL